MTTATSVPLALSALREQGRTIAWLAGKLGYSRNHVREQLIGRRRITPQQALRMAELTGNPVQLFLSAYREEVKQ